MTDNTSNANPDGVTEESGEVLSNPRDLIKAGLGIGDEQAQEPTEEATEGTEAEAEETEVETEETKEEEVEESTEESEEGESAIDVLSQYDYSSLSEEEVAALGQMFSEGLGDNAAAFFTAAQSGAGKEIGKLRGSNREKDAKIESLEAQLAEATKSMQPADNSFSEITDLEELSQKEQEVDQNIAAANQFLSGSEEYLMVGEEEVDRRTIASWLNAYIKQKSDIPVQRQRIKEATSFDGSAELEKAKQELDWISDEESELRKQFDKLSSEPDFQLFKRSFPKAGAKMERYLAHAVNSMSTEKATVPNLRLKKRDVKASGTVSSGAQSARQTTDSRKRALQNARAKISSGEYGQKDVRSLIAAAI